MILNFNGVVESIVARERIGGGMKRGDTPCPQPEQTIRFVLGLAEHEEEFIDHVRNCERCRLLVNVISEAIEDI